MTSILQDLRYTLRQMRRAPGFALVAIPTLALAIGCASAVFSVIDATIVRLYRPVHISQDLLTSRGTHFLPLIGRVKPWVTLPVAQGRYSARIRQCGPRLP